MRISWEMNRDTLEEQFKSDHRLLEPVEIINVEVDDYSETVIFEFDVDDDDVERIKSGLGGNLLIESGN